jgi:hypothetical protein
VEISRGTAGDRPWADVFAELAFAAEPCELIVETGGQAHKVAFDREAVVWASSPLAADSALRVALTYRVITTTMMPAVAVRVAAAPSADPIEVLAAFAQLDPEVVLLLRRRTIAVAATRVFGLAAGSYRVTRGLTVPVVEGTAIDVRALVYEGIRTHVAEQQLASAIAPYGSSFVLRPDAQDDVPQFGFSAVELPVVDELRVGASLETLAQRYPAVGHRGVLAIVNALLAARALAWTGEELMPPSSEPHTFARSSAQVPAQRFARTSEQQRPPTTGRPSARTSGTFDIQPDTNLGADPALDLADGAAEPFDLFADAPLDLDDHGRPRNTTIPQPALDFGDHGRPRNTTTPQPRFDLAGRPRNTTAPQPALDLDEGDDGLLELADDPPAQLDRPTRTTGPLAAQDSGARAKFTTLPPATGPNLRPRPASQQTLPDPPKRASGQHPALDPLRAHSTTNRASTPPPFEPPRTMTPHPALEPPRTTTPQHPALESPHARPTPHPALDPRTPQRSRPTQQPDPRAPQRPTPNPAVARTTTRPTQQPMLDPATPSSQEIAAQHYERGVALMDRDMERAAVELSAAARLSGDVDHHAVLAWAQFCLAPNKDVVAKATKSALAKAVYQSTKPEIAHFYLGRLERMLGRDREALDYFKTVVDLVPRHTEALAEIRILEARLHPKKR